MAGSCEVRGALCSALEHFRVKAFRSEALNAFMANGEVVAATVADALRWAEGDEFFLESADLAVVERAKAIAVCAYYAWYGSFV